MVSIRPEGLFERGEEPGRRELSKCGDAILLLEGQVRRVLQEVCCSRTRLRLCRCVVLEPNDDPGARQLMCSPVMAPWPPAVPSHLPSMGSARDSLAVGVLGGRLYAVGGYDASDTTLSSVEAYNRSADTWPAVASMGTARCVLAVGVLSGRLYAVGGWDDNDTPH